MKKYGIWLCIMFMLVLTACGKEQKATDETVYQIYEVNKEETKVASREITTTETDTEKLLGVLIEDWKKRRKIRKTGLRSRNQSSCRAVRWRMKVQI